MVIYGSSQSGPARSFSRVPFFINNYIENNRIMETY